MTIKGFAALGVLGASLLLGLTGYASTPDGQISEIEGAPSKGAILEVWSQSAGDHVELAVVADHDCELGDIYFECLNRATCSAARTSPATTVTVSTRSQQRTTK